MAAHEQRDGFFSSFEGILPACLTSLIHLHYRINCQRQSSIYLEMLKEKVSTGECDRKKVRARKCSITSSYDADNNGCGKRG